MASCLTYFAAMNYRKALVFFSLILSICILLQYYRKFNLTEKQGYYVRHCVTDRILGKVSAELQSVPFEDSKETSPENGEQRRSSFENIFKNKVWVPQEERKSENQASGNKNYCFFALTYLAYSYMRSVTSIGYIDIMIMRSISEGRSMALYHPGMR